MRSIMQDEKECYFCKTRDNLHLHHVFFGTANRRLSDEYGLTVYLCVLHHTAGRMSVHLNHDVDMLLKQQGQRAFIKHYPQYDFKSIFGRNYILNSEKGEKNE